MKGTGIVRRIDDLGRVVIPKETRKVLGLECGDPLEIFIEGNSIVLKKYEPGCEFCGQVQDITYFRGRKICANCKTELKGVE